MQSKIVECVELAFDDKGRDGTTAIQHAWLTAMGEGHLLWEVILPPAESTGPEEGKEHGRSPARDCGYYGAYMRVGLALRSFAERNNRRGNDVLRQLMTKDNSYSAFQSARARVLDDAARLLGEPIAGPMPEKTKAPLLASATSLAALSLDNLDAV